MLVIIIVSDYCIGIHVHTITTRCIVRTSVTLGQISFVKTENDIELKLREIF